MCVICDSKAAIEAAAKWTDELDRKRRELARQLEALGSTLERARGVAATTERTEEFVTSFLRRRRRFPAGQES